MKPFMRTSAPVEVLKGSNGQKAQDSQNSGEAKDYQEGLLIPIAFERFGQFVQGQGWFTRRICTKGVQGDKDKGEQGHHEQGADPIEAQTLDKGHDS